MFANQPYDPFSLMRFQVSVLSLEAALQQSAQVASSQNPAGAQIEVERLQSLIEPHDRR